MTSTTSVRATRRILARHCQDTPHLHTCQIPLSTSVRPVRPVCVLGLSSAWPGPRLGPDLLEDPSRIPAPPVSPPLPPPRTPGLLRHGRFSIGPSTSAHGHKPGPRSSAALLSEHKSILEAGLAGPLVAWTGSSTSFASREVYLQSKSHTPLKSDSPALIGDSSHGSTVGSRIARPAQRAREGARGASPFPASRDSAAVPPQSHTAHPETSSAPRRVLSRGLSSGAPGPPTDCFLSCRKATSPRRGKPALPSPPLPRRAPPSDPGAIGTRNDAPSCSPDTAHSTFPGKSSSSSSAPADSAFTHLQMDQTRAIGPRHWPLLAAEIPTLAARHRHPNDRIHHTPRALPATFLPTL